MPRTKKRETKQTSKEKPLLCNCKGNCSRKICGCVKNERKCGPTCKCDDQICQNQNLEGKENVEAKQNEIIHRTEKLENVPLKDKTEHKNLFSPEGIENEADLSSIQFEDIRFDTQKNLTYTFDEELQNKDKSKIGNDIIKKKNKEKKDKSDKKHVAVSKNIKIKARKTNKNQAEELGEFESKIIQASPLSEKDDKISMSEANVSFDPMKPKHQLPRTPPRGNIECEPEIEPEVPTIVETSIEKTVPKVDIIPDELNQENVDLNKLHIKLVNCDKCKRTFYPWRVAVHRSACLGL